MQLTSKHYTQDKGFTLIEIAIVMIVIGVIASAAISIYQQQRAEQDWERTNSNIDDIILEITNFYQTYGRYPCPASSTAPQGDPLYGNEKANCTPNAVGNCADGVCTVASLNAPQEIMIGSVPFKRLNLQDKQTYDAYLNRYTYAVTASLTDIETFDPTTGGISVEDGNGNTMVDPEHTAHFVLISHGRDGSGAITRSAVLASPCAGAEADNCNGDELFISREIDSDFDDLIRFHTQFAPTEWRSSEDDTSVALKDKEKTLINAKAGDNVSGEDDDDIVIVRQHSADDDGAGDIHVDNKVYTDKLCQENVDLCFDPRRIGGSLTPEDANDPNTLYYEDGSGNGISCYDPNGGMEYLRGISNNQPDCIPEIVLECPDGEFITSVVDGIVRCNSIVQDCMEENITTFCGDNRTLPQSPQSTRISEFSGECHYITDYDDDYFEVQTAGLSMNQANAQVINPINNEDRNTQNCNSGNSSQIRDTYVCEEGEWDTLTPHEKRHPWSNFPSNVYNTGGYWSAENSHNGSDPNNDNGYHDCWCREDYRVVESNCPDGSPNAYRVQKHVCPQTSHRWYTIYTNDENCSCSPGTQPDEMSCNAFFNDQFGNPNTNNPDNGLTGTVYLTYAVTCDGNTPVVSDDPISADASECACLNGSPHEERTSCTPSHYTNSWTNKDGGHEVNVAQIERTPWTCPGTERTHEYGGMIDDPAFLDDANSTIETATNECSCEGGTVPRQIPCGEGSNGYVQEGYIYYDAPIDCITGEAVEDENLWNETGRDCKGCRWDSSASPTMKGVGLGVAKGGSCDCGSGTQEFCSQGPIGSALKYKTWINCQCVKQ